MIRNSVRYGHTRLKAECPLEGFVRVVATVVAVASLVGCGGSDNTGSHSISGTLTGLTTAGLVLANGSDTVALSSGATTFRFPSKVANGIAYSVTVKEQPTDRDQVCDVSNGSGFVIGSDVNTIVVSCRATQWAVSTFAGTGLFGSVDGSANAASFGNPLGVAVDGSGIVYVADGSNKRIRKIALDGTVSTLAGSGASGSADGSGPNATFSDPVAAATDASGNVYVTDLNKVRAISSTGAVKTLAGSDIFGSSDGTGSDASFGFLGDLTLDSSGNIYVADWGNSLIRRITPGGVVTTIAGTGETGSTDGPASTATFYVPRGIAIDTAGNLYVADSGNNKIRKIDTNGEVSTLAGSGISTFADGLGTAASFANPYSVAVDTHGNIFVVDTFNVRLRKITADGVVTTVAGSGAFGAADAIGSAASFTQPSSIATDVGGGIYVADSGNCKIRGVRSQ